MGPQIITSAILNHQIGYKIYLNDILYPNRFYKHLNIDLEKLNIIDCDI